MRNATAAAIQGCRALPGLFLVFALFFSAFAGMASAASSSIPVYTYRAQVAPATFVDNAPRAVVRTAKPPVQPAAPTKVVTIPDGDGLSQVGADNNTPLEVVLDLNPQYRTHPNTVPKDAKIVVLAFPGATAPAAPAAPAPVPTVEMKVKATAFAASDGSSVALRALDFALAVDANPKIRYKLGTQGPNSYDCSGLVSAAFKNAGADLPRTTAKAYSQMAGKGFVSVPRDQIRAGDLVFFYSPVSHVGIARDNQLVVHASTDRNALPNQVRTSSIDDMPYHSALRYVG